ncbi:hypothetical protein [Desulfuromonas thiophila]|uniref:Uncharacterized protein n=1 Tax=Desulfuromonas thiophila TaxID=57664 RepID=A0A1G7DQD4_9BACT|nr:hypothetical protein [Desulfuromonas thiophila]SDE53731.1 hypothetical protein SAMN05661003_11510 [Desulfuromonas thiophila]
MIGLLFIAAAVVYLIISIGVIRLVVRWAKKRGRRPVLWGFVAALVMYHLVFWDFIPTYALYKYYCATKAGFWVYKTPEQWKTENPGVAETLTWRELSPQFNNSDDSWGFKVNERFIWEIETLATPFLPVRRTVETIVDVEKNEVVVKRVSVRAGYKDGMELIKFWTSMGPFVPKSKEFGELQDNFKQIGRYIK